MHAVQSLIDYLREDLKKRGHGQLYTATKLAESLGERGVVVSSADIVQQIRDSGGICVRYRGGHSRVPITFDRPNRSAVLQQIGPELFSFDTEAAVQNGLQEWFCRQGWIACAEVPDSEDVIAGIAERRSIEHLPDRSDSRSTKCRDLMAYVQDGAYATFHIVEVKGQPFQGELLS